jgi:hypothetical protein
MAETVATTATSIEIPQHLFFETEALIKKKKIAQFFWNGGCTPTYASFDADNIFY